MLTAGTCLKKSWGSPATNFIENAVCGSASGDNMEEEEDQYETVDDSKQSREGKQMSLSTEVRQRAGLPKLI